MLNRAELEAFLIGYTYDLTHRTHKRAVRSQVACANHACRRQNALPLTENNRQTERPNSKFINQSLGPKSNRTEPVSEKAKRE